jgi:hypothetical protein
MLDLIGALDLDVFAVVGAAESRHHIELVRERCLRELFRITRPLAPSSVIIESRERSTGIVGQNRRDYATLIDAATSPGSTGSVSGRVSTSSVYRPNAHDPRLPQSVCWRCIAPVGASAPPACRLRRSSLRSW